MFRYCIVIVLSIYFNLSECYTFLEKPGPRYPPTKGEVWPQPQHEIKTQTYYTFNPSNFQFKVTSQTCNILEKALERCVYQLNQYHELISKAKRRLRKELHRIRLCSRSSRRVLDDNYQGVIKELEIILSAPCEEYPHLDMNESYNLTISSKSSLMSASIWGILQGLETFSQLFYISDNYNEIRINTTHIEDYPRYSHRGLLLDTSRHYLSVNKIYKMLDAMSYNKLNVFHWHIVDDQSFPYQSEKFPEISERGAFSPHAIYTKSDIENIIYYAKNRGIRVIPEFDVPGHTRSWGEAYPDILTKCYEGEDIIGFGPMNPIENSTYKLIRDLFAEVNQLFPDKYLHVGGDEVEMSCWSSNPDLINYMLEHNMSSVAELHTLFMTNTLPLLQNDKKAIVWQEVFDEKVVLPKDTLIQVWKSYPISEMIDILKDGYRVLFSSSWYLDQATNLGTWHDFYLNDPREMIRNSTLEDGIIGGEACMWGEMVDDSNVISRVWPRASAVAERLWTTNVGTVSQAMNRLEEHTCRMIKRGIHAQPPNGPGYCFS